MPTRCFMIVPTGWATRELRRYSTGDVPCPGRPGSSYHNASKVIGRSKVTVEKKTGHYHIAHGKTPPRSDPRWPKKCELCAYRFTVKDHWQVFGDRFYHNRSTRKVYSLRDLPPGAMYDADWLPWKGPDGRSLIVETPGGSWNIDGPASNCTMPDDCGQRRHHCWCRHGIPPNITVDKQCTTCSAGAGSIQSGTYHGFLQNGVLT